jgi:glycerate 2-kinase
MNTAPRNLSRMRQDALDIFYAGLKAADPVVCLERSCSLDGDVLTIKEKRYDLAQFRHIYVIGAGKASAAMASAVENILGSRISRGIINVKYGHVTNLEHIDLMEAGHPIPDRNGATGAEAILQLAEDAGIEDLVICLISGGGSALLPSPAKGLRLNDKQETIRLLLSCGATIQEINTIRKHTSGIKGGRLARACYPASVVSLILSDVVGDDLDAIASGPTVPDPGTFQDCMDIVAKYQLADSLPQSLMLHLRGGFDGKIEETPKPDNIAFKNVHNVIIGNNFQTLEAAARHAENLGYHSLILSSLFEGETRDVAFFHAAIIKEIIKSNHPVDSPACVLSGGETTVTLSGDGLGGRNQEFALASALSLKGFNNYVLLSTGTDGTDGPTDAAGAIVDSETLHRAGANRLDANDHLKRNDSYSFFKSLGDHLITGPTRTNVMDLRIFLVG